MKKLLSILTAVALCLCLFACGGYIRVKQISINSYNATTQFILPINSPRAVFSPGDCWFYSEMDMVQMKEYLTKNTQYKYTPSGNGLLIASEGEQNSVCYLMLLQQEKTNYIVFDMMGYIEKTEQDDTFFVEHTILPYHKIDLIPSVGGYPATVQVGEEYRFRGTVEDMQEFYEYVGYTVESTGENGLLITAPPLSFAASEAQLQLSLAGSETPIYFAVTIENGVVVFTDLGYTSPSQL